MIGLSLSLLAVLIIFLTGIDQTGKPDTCRAVAILLQYFLLCTFFWMVVEAYNLYRRLIVVWDDHIHYFLPKSIIFAHGKDKCSFLQAEFLLGTNFFRFWCSRGNLAYIWERIFLLVWYYHVVDLREQSGLRYFMLWSNLLLSLSEILSSPVFFRKLFIISLKQVLSLSSFRFCCRHTSRNCRNNCRRWLECLQQQQIVRNALHQPPVLKCSQ